MQQVLIEEDPPVDIAIIIVWIDMLAADSEETGDASARIFHDTRVRQFHDPNRYLGKIVAESLGGRDAIAWDTYLFYAKGSEWKEDMPALLDWAHQLDDPWIDPDHFAGDDDLPARLRQITNSLIRN